MGFPKVGFAKRLLILYSVIFILVLLVTDWTLSHFLQKRDLLELQSSLTRQSVLVRELAVPLLGDPGRLQKEISKIAAETDVRVTIIAPDGIVLADSRENLEQLSKMDNHAQRPEIAAALRKETGLSIRYSMTLKTRMLYVAVPILQSTDIPPSPSPLPLKGGEDQGEGVTPSSLNGEKILGVVRTAMPVTRVDEILASVRRSVMIAVVPGILIILVAGILFNNHLTKRIRRITSVAERYAREDWSEKILMDGQDELKMLANTMNQMAAALRSRIEDLETEKGKVAVILNHMNEGVIAVDLQKQVVIMNPAAERIFGSSATVRGKSLIEVTRHPQIEKIVDLAFKEQRTASEEIHLSGETRKTLRLSVVVLKGPARDIGGILVFHDMTELRRLENVRKEFVTNVSHELRTPLTSIKGFVETLLGGASKDPLAGERFLRIIAEETERLGRLVEDILTLGEIEQKMVLMRKDRIDLASELAAILESFRLRIEKSKIQVEDRISGKPLIITGDRDKVRQVFVNLLDNAVKFNKPEGRIVLSEDQAPEGITVTVEDAGVGIPKDVQERVFERFFRADKARSKELGGTGLGLAIVKHIMEAHGGHAACQSTPGQGSRFSVFFPRAG